RNVEESRDTVMELFTDLPDLLRRHQVERFRPWVHTVMRNRCLMRLRGRGREADAPPPDVADEDLRGEALLREASLQKLEAAIAALKEEQRTCITLFHLEGLTYAEVATRTGFSLEEVRSHLQNGRRNLRLMLNNDADRN
ncbi:MAG TPA: sigma-70 family RNA polymerase sigma factor, partial [Flavobacteriales bacterium]|nr:sigma-70 family RNA polymerase sigma factor [Flavobacteriales bacterium]